MRLGAMILSGGPSSRMGADKGGLDWLGRRAVDRVAELAAELGAETTITVGTVDYGLVHVADEPPLGGPVGGVLAGAQALRAAGCERALVLAVDAPSLTVADLAPLLARHGPGAAFEGLHLPLVLELSALPGDARADWAMARLVERAGVVRLPCSPGGQARLRGANTPEERDVLLAELRLRENAQNGGAG